MKVELYREGWLGMNICQFVSIEINESNGETVFLCEDDIQREIDGCGLVKRSFPPSERGKEWKRQIIHAFQSCHSDLSTTNPTNYRLDRWMKGTQIIIHNMENLKKQEFYSDGKSEIEKVVNAIGKDIGVFEK